MMLLSINGLGFQPMLISGLLLLGVIEWILPFLFTTLCRSRCILETDAFFCLLKPAKKQYVRDQNDNSSNLVYVYNPKAVFHYVSYLQYPIMASSFIFYLPFVISLGQGEPDWYLLNNFIILIGVALSFSTLQDTTKTQNKISKRVWEDPRKGKIALSLMAIMAFSFIILGLTLIIRAGSGEIENIAIGLTVLGIGLLGLLKSALEMFENHRLDYQTTGQKEDELKTD
jgi:hypothetical protein